MDREPDHVFRAVCNHWLAKINQARDHKRQVFQKDADECMSFYNGPRNWDQLMGGAVGMASDEILPELTFKMSVNKAFELVTIFGPSLYFQNPVRTVSLKQPVEVDPNVFPDPMLYQAIAMQEEQRLYLDGIRATVIESYLNFTPTDSRLATHSRLAIEEALIKGRGCLWTELVSPPGASFNVVGSQYDTVDSLLIDPDAPSLDQATWVARRCISPVWQVERDYGLKTGTLKGNMESHAIQSEVDSDADSLYDRKRGLTNDLMVYYKVYSKMGVGGRLSGLNRNFRGPLELFGDYCFLAIAKDVPYPLNLPPEVQETPGYEGQPEIVLDRVAWPTPYWALTGGWPVSVLDFHPIPNCPWPLSHLRAGIGELKFLNWAHSFLAGKLRNTTRDFIAVKKSASEEIKTAILEGRDLTLLEIDSEHGTIADVVQFLQHPEVNGDIWRLIAAIEENFDKRVGLNELMYGEEGSTQIRSAQEASIRNQNMSVRPDDMAKVVESWMSDVAAKEAVAARYHLTRDDVTPLLGTFAGAMWQQYVASQDVNAICRGLDYRIEAGSAKKPNKDTAVQQTQDGLQTFLPVFQQYAMQTGDTTPLNNLIADWCKARDLPPDRYQMSAAPLPMPAPAAGEGGPEAPPPGA